MEFYYKVYLRRKGMLSTKCVAKALVRIGASAWRRSHGEAEGGQTMTSRRYISKSL